MVDEGRQSIPAISPIGALVLVFFVLGALVSGDIGATADERETLLAGQRNLEIIAAWAAGEPAPDWSFHELTGFYFVVDTARALWGGALAGLGMGDPYRAQHLAHLLMSCATLWLLFLLARRAGASPRAALLAALALATLPKFVAHSQNNPKDLPATFAFVLALYGVVSTGLRGGFARAALAGAALGLAVTTRVHAVFVLLVGWAWLGLAAPKFERRDVTNQLVLVASAAACALAFWPWLWASPIDNLTATLQQLGSKVFTIPVLYLGQVIPAHEVPWHYRGTLLLATTPLSWLAIAAFGCFALRDRERGKGAERAVTGAANAARLAAIWLAVLALADGLVWSRYDGMRHFLMALPALALFAGLGADRAVHWLEAHELPRVLHALPLLPFAIGALAIATLHPYPGAVLGAPARALAGDAPDRFYELDYWGQSYLAAGRWLEQHAEPNAAVVVPLFPRLARHSIGPEVQEGLVADWAPVDRPRYLVLLTRRAYWDEPLHALERDREPVFEIRRSGGRLLAIYRNDAAPLRNPR